MTFPTGDVPLAQIQVVDRFNAREGLVTFPTRGIAPSLCQKRRKGFNAREGLVTFPTEANLGANRSDRERFQCP